MAHRSRIPQAQYQYRGIHQSRNSHYNSGHRHPIPRNQTGSRIIGPQIHNCRRDI